MTTNPFILFQQKIRGNPKALNRVIKSYEMMLDFYGLKLKSRETGTVYTVICHRVEISALKLLYNSES